MAYKYANRECACVVPVFISVCVCVNVYACARLSVFMRACLVCMHVHMCVWCVGVHMCVCPQPTRYVKMPTSGQPAILGVYKCSLRL